VPTPFREEACTHTMFTYPRCQLLVTCSLLMLGPASRSQSPDSESKPSTLPKTEITSNRAALRLPPGARLRLGSGVNQFGCMAFSTDGKMLASGGYEKTITIWDPARGKVIRQWNGPENNIASVLFSPDGRLLASGGVYDPIIHLWEVSTGREVHTLQGLPRGTSSLSFSPDGKVLAAGGYMTGEVYLWKVATGQPLARLAGPPVPSAEVDMQPRSLPEFSHVAFAPGGKNLASGHRHGLIRIWDVVAFRELSHHRGPIEDSFVHLAFSCDGRFLTSWGTRIRLWRPNGWKQLRHFGQQPELWISTVAISPDNRMIASGSSAREIGDDTVHVWEVATGSERCHLSGHQYAIASLAFSPDGTTLVSGSRDGTALVWDLKNLPYEHAATTSLSNEELASRWRELEDAEAPRAYAAIRTLVSDPPRTIPFLQRQLRPVFRAEPQRVHELVAALDSDQFSERQDATEELATQVELLEPAIRQARSGRASAEVRRRLEQILRIKEQALSSNRQLQMLRGIEVLENIGSPEAKNILQAVASGTSEFRITLEAKASLDRLARRASR
jgi:WD40 repeat protein